jgi:hypothetical protein
MYAMASSEGTNNQFGISNILISNREDYTGHSYKGTHESSHARKSIPWSILVLFTRVLGILKKIDFDFCHFMNTMSFGSEYLPSYDPKRKRNV